MLQKDRLADVSQLQTGWFEAELKQNLRIGQEVLNSVVFFVAGIERSVSVLFTGWHQIDLFVDLYSLLITYTVYSMQYAVYLQI